MKSRITIELDYEKGNSPVLQVLQIDSDDVRDGMIKHFLQSLGHTSRWLRVEYKAGFSDFTKDRDDVNRWHIVPIKPEDLKEEMALMQSVLENRKDRV